MKNELLTQLEQNRMCDELGELEIKLDKVLTVTSFLLNEYGTIDDEQSAEKMKFEARQIMGFIEIVSDYVHSTYEGLKDLQKKL